MYQLAGCVEANYAASSLKSPFDKDRAHCCSGLNDVPPKDRSTSSHPEPETVTLVEIGLG